MSAGSKVDFMIHGLFSYNFFGHEVWITTSHVCILLVLLIILGFAVAANRKMAKATDVPDTFQNIVELVVELLDHMIEAVMGKNAKYFANYVGTIFIFILISNFSGLLGLRPPTADYATTFALAVMTFCIITFQKFKHQHVKGVLAGLCSPWVFWAPINLIGDFAVPVSMSLRQRPFRRGHRDVGLHAAVLDRHGLAGVPARLFRPVQRRDPDLRVLYADDDLCEPGH